MLSDACAALVERGDPDRFASVMASPVSARDALFTLYAFNLEVARAPWVTQETLIAEMRLQWWRDAVTGDKPLAHEVASPLQLLMQTTALPRDVLDRLVAARRWDVYREPFGEGEFAAYLDDTAGGLMWLAALALGAGPTAEPAVRAFGRAAGLAAFLRAVPELTARGRVPLADASPGAVARLVGEGLGWLIQARSQRRLVPRSVIPALLAGWQTHAVLSLAEKDPARVFTGPLALSEAHRRGLLLWQATTGRW